MEIKVIEEIENPILNRREIRFAVEHDGPTPSRKSVAEKIAATMGSKMGLVMVDSLKSVFGKRETLGYAKIYETEERAKEVERSYVIARNVPNPAAEESS